MDLLEAIIRIIEENACPLYAEGDEFHLCATSLVLPPDKPVCLILVGDITDLCEKTVGGPDREVFYCSGCTGRVRLTYKKESSAQEPPKKSDAELAAMANLLNRFEIFRTLNDASLKQIIGYLKMKKYTAGDIVIRRGDVGRNLFVIVSGRVEVLGEDDVIIAFLEAGEVFGELSLLSGTPVSATIRVVEPTRLLYISSKDFRQFLNRHPALQMYFVQLLARRLSETNMARFEEFSSGMIGKLSEMSPAELFQTLNANQKSGVLILELSTGVASASFRDGLPVRARYEEDEGREAFFRILKEKQGRFKFRPRLPQEDQSAEPLGDFMWLLMEGARMADEEP